MVPFSRRMVGEFSITIYTPPTIHNEDIPQILYVKGGNLDDEIEKNYQRIKIEVTNLIQIELNKPAESVPD